MLKPLGLVCGHYECRSLDETIPVFTDLLAMKVVERKDDEATLMHPNTAWSFVVHEGGPQAPDKGFDNHYGFRVASHNEVEAAWEYLEANKEKYHLTKITKPQKAHYAYSVYFNEPGGNTLEIEYYNPGGALHGRSHTAAHWQTALTTEQFPGRGYLPQALSHGTLQCDNAGASIRFYVDILGLENAGGMNQAVYVKHPDTPWYIVVLPRSPRRYLTPASRFTLRLGSCADVEEAHRRFVRDAPSLRLGEIGELQGGDGPLRFIFQRSRSQLVGADGMTPTQAGLQPISCRLSVGS